MTTPSKEPHSWLSNMMARVFLGKFWAWCPPGKIGMSNCGQCHEGCWALDFIGIPCSKGHFRTSLRTVVDCGSSVWSWHFALGDAEVFKSRLVRKSLSHGDPGQAFSWHFSYDIDGESLMISSGAKILAGASRKIPSIVYVSGDYQGSGRGPPRWESCKPFRTAGRSRIQQIMHDEWI